MDKEFRIMIIDDDVHLAATIKSILDGEGYVTHIAHDGQAALDMCQGMVFDLALVDIKLPDVSGIVLVDKLLEIQPAMEAIIITGYAALDTAVEAVRQRPILSYLTKPLNMDQFLAFIRQVVKRRRAEKSQRESEARLKAIFEAARDVSLVMTDTAGMNAPILEFSAGAENIFGYSQEEIIGRPIGMLHALDDIYVQPPEIEAIWRCDEISPREATLIKKSGERFPALLSTYPVNDAGGNMVAVVGVSIDITERKQMEHAQKYHANQLEDMVGQRTAELKASKDVLVKEIAERKKIEERLKESYEKEKALREQLETEINKQMQFTRALAHELKTPLTSILMSSQTLGNELCEEPLRSLAKNISRGASNLNDRIDELLDVARGEIGMLQLKAEMLDIRPLLQEAIDDMDTLAASREITLIAELAPSLPLVWADEVRIKQIVLNLLNNALKFTPEGGRVCLQAGSKDSKLLVEIQDTGPGIPDEERKLIFDLYHRVRVDRAEYSGLGIGLALCKSLVVLHGGDIWVESNEGEGSTFSFTLLTESAESTN